MLDSIIDSIEGVKVRVTVSIEKSVHDRLKGACNGKPISRVINNIIKSYLGTEKPVTKALVDKPKTRAINKTISVNKADDFVFVLNQDTIDNLKSLYPSAEFIQRELIKMTIWLSANPQKNKKTSKGWSMFVSRWLNKAWPEYQKNLPSNKLDHNQLIREDTKRRINEMFDNE